MEVMDLKRELTHTGYQNDKKYKPGKWSRILRKEISTNIRERNIEGLDRDRKYFISVNDKFYSTKFQNQMFPLQLIILSIVCFLVFSFATELGSMEGIISRLVALSIFIFAIVYYYTTPKRETILNRMEGTITFPGAFWQENYTMPFDSVAFILSSPSRNLVSHKLQIIRPDSWLFDNSYSIDNCYRDLSFITWYLDKNRPLPTGTAFDPYRQRDFERRKAEGFPPPLYKSAIPTPEATSEQQKEREKYWKDYEYCPDPNNEDFAIPSI